MRWLARHQVRATRLGLPLQMCEPKSPWLLAQGARGACCSSAGRVADNTRLIREKIASAQMIESLEAKGHAQKQENASREAHQHTCYERFWDHASICMLRLMSRWKSETNLMDNQKQLSLFGLWPFKITIPYCSHNFCPLRYALLFAKCHRLALFQEDQKSPYSRRNLPPLKLSPLQSLGCVLSDKG